MRAYDLMLDVQENNKCIMYKYDPNTYFLSQDNNNAPPYVIQPQLQNAFSILRSYTEKQHQQGAVVNLAGMAEERPFDTNIADGTHYSSVEFLDIIGYSIAHELFHLIGGTDNQGPLSNSYSPFNGIIISPNELRQINFKTRQGVTQ